MHVRTTMRRLELEEATFVARSFPSHFHESLSIGIVETGAERLSIGGASMVAHAQTTVVINPGEIHAHAAFDDAPWTYRALYVSPALVAHRRKLLGSPPPPRARCRRSEHEVAEIPRSLDEGGRLSATGGPSRPRAPSCALRTRCSA